MMHKDLSDEWREVVECDAAMVARNSHVRNQSLAIAREAWLAAFDKAASELDSDGKA